MYKLKYLFKKNRLKKTSSSIDLDEIFLDSENIQQFDIQQFEGRLERPVSKKTIWFLGFAFTLCIVIFLGRLGYLQINKGEAYLERSQNNTLGRHIIFADRGIIYDRNKKELVWNKKDDISDFAVRSYLPDGFSHVLGYVSYPAQDKVGHYWQEEFIGKDGIEKQYNDKLAGENGTKIVETDAKGNIYSENVVNAPKRGEDIVLALDFRIQEQLFKSIKNLTEKISFNGGAGMIMDAQNGEIIASASYPEYNSEILSLGKDNASISQYLNDKRKVFLDRTLSGLYTPGSIVKPFVALGVLNEGVIDPSKKILSAGSISIPNPFFPELKSIFKDWKVHGWVDMRQALAVSSDVYFYQVGGGFEGQPGIGIANIEKYSRMFGIGEKTGVDMPDEKEGIIPNPEWKAKNFKGDPWRVGDTYNTAIGQYGYQVTLIQMARAISAIANDGTLLTPHFLLSDKEMELKSSIINLNQAYFDIVHEGMRKCVTEGTCIALNVPYVKVAGKTGTAQLGIALNKVNSWVVGFFPYDKPKYVFVILMEAGPANNNIGAPTVMREFLDWMSLNTPEYFK